jgi:hypothetical protein
MSPDRVLEIIRHLPRRTVREAFRIYQLIRLSILNRVTTKLVMQNDGPVVSLTTHTSRAKFAHFAIESIAAGVVRPSQLILWIDDNALFQSLPKTLKRLQKRGLNVRLCKSYGPHSKYYPYVADTDIFDSPLVIADDDVLYPRYWLRSLIEENRRFPNYLNCYGAQVIVLDGHGFARYSSFHTVTQYSRAP